MNVRDIQRRLMVERYRQSLVCPNYTPRNWWECDVFELTKAGYFREYEIKLTLADFRADKNKTSVRWDGKMEGSWNTIKENKHEFLQRGDTFGPAQFWFIAPEGLIPHVEIPNWAGLMECWTSPQDKRLNHFNQPLPKVSDIRIREAKKAPRLHGQKADPKIKEHVSTIFYYRFQKSFLFKKLETEPFQTDSKIVMDSLHPSP